MCGIVGARDEWLRQNGLEPESALGAAVEELRWRGPDGIRVVRAGEWWLGCARLAITQPNSTQPVARRGGQLLAVLNGAITNARELWGRLLPGAERRPAPPNDAWLPLLAVERGDAGILAQLRGHHAYAVVDRRTGELILGQDRFGEKPLYCLHGRGERGRRLLAFASTPAALRALGMPAIGQPRRLGDWFRYGFADPVPHRFHARLCLDAPRPRGIPLVAEPGPRSWCRPWGTRPLAPSPGLRSPCVRDLRQALVDSVDRCTDTTVPVALLLSGGLDSSCLAAALRILGRSPPAYQFRADGAPEGEREVARAVAERCGLAFRPVGGGPELLDALPHLTALVGMPLGDPSVLAVHAVARAAAAGGARVVLGGEGADELFLGYRRYRALAHLPRLPRLAAASGGWSMRYAARWWRAVLAPDPASSLLAVTPPAFGSRLLAPALASRRSWRDLGPRIRPDAPRSSPDPVLLARTRDLEGYLRCDLLPKVDVATMAAGLEARCPWLEGDLATLGQTRAAMGKAQLRTAFRNDLPASVFRLPKHGFSLPLDRWFRLGGPWLDLLAEARTRQRPHLRPGGLGDAVDRHRSGRSDLGHGLYLLLAYELFLRTQDEDSRLARTKSDLGA